MSDIDTMSGTIKPAYTKEEIEEARKVRANAIEDDHICRSCGEHTDAWLPCCDSPNRECNEAWEILNSIGEE